MYTAIVLRRIYRYESENDAVHNKGTAE